MGSTTYGEYTALDPAISVNSVAYGAALKFTMSLPVFDPSNAPTVEYAVVNTSGWTALDAANYKAYWPEGLILLRESWLASLASRTGLCFRFSGQIYRQTAHCPKRIYVDLADAIDSLDELFIPIGIRTSGHLQLTGGTGVVAPQPSGWVCDGTQWLPTGWVAGGSNSEFRDPYDSLPLWEVGPFAALQYVDNIHGASSAGANTQLCNGNPQDVDDYCANDGESFTFVSPFGSARNSGWSKGDGASNFHFGSNYNQPFIGFGDGSITYGYGCFNFEGIPITLPAEFSRMMDGCTIIEAKWQVKIGGLRERTWSCTWSDAEYITNPDSTSNRRTSINGYEAYVLRYEGGLIVENKNDPGGIPSDPTTGNVGFGLIAKEKNTGSITDYNGTLHNADASTFRGLGGAIASTSLSGSDWTIIDVKQTLEALLDDKNSRATEYFLFPSIAIQPGDGVGTLGQFVRSMMPSVSVSSLNGGRGFSYSASGSVTYGTTFETKTQIYVRYRLPSGAIGERCLPFLVGRRI